MTPMSIAAEPTSPTAPTARLSHLVSFPAAIAALLMMLAVLTVRGRFDDPDMWWHLKYGQVIVTTHHIPAVDIFSYTTNHHPIIPHEWLAEVSIYAAYAVKGYAGLMSWECLLTVSVILAGFYLCSLSSGNPKFGFMGALVIWAFGTVGYAVRPHMIGYLLLIAELLILQLGRSRSRYWFCLLPPLFATWVNCHGSFMLGFLVLIITAGGDLRRLTVRSSGSNPPSHAKYVVSAAALCIPALFLNPVGLQQVLYPLQIMWHSPLNLAAIQEWRRVQFDDPRTYAFISSIAFICIGACLRKIKIRTDELLIFATISIEAARHERLLFPFGIIAAPLLCRGVAELLTRKSDDEQHPIANAVLMAAAVLTSVAAFPTTSKLNQQVEASSPVKAVNFIHEHHLSGPIMNDYGFGGYLIWAAPDYPVFVDGRTDIFEWTGVLRKFGDWATLKNPTSKLLDDYSINLCLVGKSAPVVESMRRLPSWRQVYVDDNSVIFQRDSPQRSSAEKDDR